MERLAAWLWRRFRRHFVPAVAVAVGLATLIVVAGPALVFLFALYRDVGKILPLLLTAVVAIGIASFGALYSLQSLVRPINNWARGDTSDPDAAWRAALVLPELLAVRAFAFGLPAVIVGATTVGYFVIERSTQIVLAIGLGVIGTSCLAVLLLGISTHLFFGPVLLEVAPHVRDRTPPTRRGWTLRFRVVAIVGLLALLGVVYGSALTRDVGNPSTLFLVGEAVGIAWAIFAIAVAVIAVVQPAFRPMQTLLEGVHRVASGDFDIGVPVSSLDEFGELTIAFNEMQQGLRERASLQQAFGSYVDPALAERLLSQDSSVFEGEEVDVTVFFADVRGFTTYAASTTAREAVARLNRLFELIVPIIRDNGGHANGYAGDGVLAVFGTPNPLDQPADNAVAAAIEIQRQVCAEFGDELKLGIGVNTGPVIAGTIGGGGKLEFTVIGDAVNVASRVEALTKETGDGILLTQETLDALTRKPSVLDRGAFEIRGKTEQLRLYAIAPTS